MTPPFVIKISDDHFVVPIKNKTVTPIIKDDIKYIPTLTLKPTTPVKKPITPTKPEVKTFKIDNYTYIPEKAVPKVY